MRDSLPILLGTLPYALVLGAEAHDKGMTLLEVPLMTGLNFAGGSEFAAVQLWAAPPPLLVIVAITFLINSRHLLMGAVMSPYLRHLPLRHVLPALFVLCDESWALSLADCRKREKAGKSPFFSFGYYGGVVLPFFLVWVGFTTLGALIGPFLGPLDRTGLDMAFPAVFLVLLRSMWEGARAARPWLTSLVVAALSHLLLPGAWYVALGALAGLVHAALQPLEDAPTETPDDRNNQTDKSPATEHGT